MTRYGSLLKTTPYRILRPSKDLPKWLAHRHRYTVWQRSNLWILHNALATGHNLTLIALCNGEPGDGPGRTADRVEDIGRRGGEVVRVGAGLFGAQ